jgi:hypothetical protein
MPTRATTGRVHDRDTARRAHIALPAAACQRWRGEVVPQEGQQVAWVEAPALAQYEMPPADLPLIPSVLAAMEQARRQQQQQQ